MKPISLEPMNGWAIAKRIVQISNNVLQVQQGSLYPALHRLEHQGWITAEWKDSENTGARNLFVNGGGTEATQVGTWKLAAVVECNRIGD